MLHQIFARTWPFYIADYFVSTGMKIRTVVFHQEERIF